MLYVCGEGVQFSEKILQVFFYEPFPKTGFCMLCWATEFKFEAEAQLLVVSLSVNVSLNWRARAGRSEPATGSLHLYYGAPSPSLLPRSQVQNLMQTPERRSHG